MRKTHLARFALMGAAAILACEKKAPLAPPVPGLVAAVERQNEIALLRRINDEWVPEKHLPKNARALRFSEDGGTVTWVQDETADGGMRPMGYVQRWGAEKPEPLGPLGLRTRAAMGLAPGKGTEIALLTPTGDLQISGSPLGSLGPASDPSAGPTGQWAFVNQKQCLATTDGLVPPNRVCSNAIRPLQFAENTLLARDNFGLWTVTRDNVGFSPMKEVIDARMGKHGTMLVLRRIDDGGKPADAVFLTRPGEPIREVSRGAIIISARLDADGGVLVVRAPARNDLYQLLLAHAPDEFGGEATSGHAWRYSPAHLKESEIPGLEYELVRALFRAL